MKIETMNIRVFELSGWKKGDAGERHAEVFEAWRELQEVSILQRMCGPLSAY